MHRTARHALSFAALGLSLGLGFCLLPAPASAQVAPRAYAPEDLSQLSRADQTRVISLEYSEQSGGRRIPDDQLRFYLDQVNRSNWTFSRIKQDIATSLSGGGSGWRPPVNPPGTGWQTVRCESTNNRQRSCPVGWNGPSRLTRQLSGSACIEGRTWRSERGAVWVSGGCRAEFQARNTIRPPVVGNYQVTCSSNGNRVTTCAWDRSRGRPRLLQQLSNSPCTENRTWGYNRQEQLWVSNGCRGRFGNR